MVHNIINHIFTNEEIGFSRADQDPEISESLCTQNKTGE